MSKKIIWSEKMESRLLRLVRTGDSSQEIAEKFGFTYPTILKKCRQIGVGDLVCENGRRRQHTSMYIDGRGTYRKFKKDNCEECGVSESEKRLVVHHIIPAKYDRNWQIQSGYHDESNLMTVCDSCHLKIHYRQHNRPRTKSNGRRFFTA